MFLILQHFVSTSCKELKFSMFMAETFARSLVYSFTIDISNLPTSVYFMRITTKNETITKKIIKY